MIGADILVWYIVGAYTSRVRFQAILPGRLSDTRHTSFYSTVVAMFLFQSLYSTAVAILYSKTFILLYSNTIVALSV